MLATAVIVFREVLEAALIIAIVLGASRGIAARGRWVTAGAFVGFIGACIVAAFAGELARSLAGSGQALLNAGILLAAVGMLAWHNIWMSSHGRKMAADMRVLGSAVQDGSKPVLALAIIVAAAVMREGSELVLFLWAIAASGAGDAGMAGGALIGLTSGIAVGILLYRGLLRIPLRHFFSVTGWLVLLLAAGLAAQAAGFINQAGLLPALGTSWWDTSHLLSQRSIVGQLLHILVGYTARPSGIQILFYVATFMTIFSLMRMVGRRERTLSASV